MKKLVKKLEDIFAAAAFAEAGEFETARQIAEGDGPRAGRRKAEDKADGREGQKGITPPYPSKA
ncbi:MAG: hypothetical protein P8Y85_07370 [Nitrospirota bacterium]|jgi:hypothetical protein